MVPMHARSKKKLFSEVDLSAAPGHCSEINQRADVEATVFRLGVEIFLQRFNENY